MMREIHVYVTNDGDGDYRVSIERIDETDKRVITVRASSPDAAMKLAIDLWGPRWRATKAVVR